MCDGCRCCLQLLLLQIEDLRPKVEPFHVVEHASSGLQQHHHNLHQLQHDQQTHYPAHQQHSQHAPHTHHPSTQRNTKHSRLPDLYLTWTRNHAKADGHSDACVHELYALLGYAPPSNIKWMPNTRDVKKNDVCFTSVQDLAQFDSILRFCKRDSQCVHGCMVSADLSKSAKEFLPEVTLQFSHLAGPQLQTRLADVQSIACAARLPEPLSVIFTMQRDECCLRYVLPAQSEAFIAYCQQHSVYRRDGASWKLDCSLSTKLTLQSRLKPTGKKKGSGVLKRSARVEEHGP